jgi:hypothetical protein
MDNEVKKVKAIEEQKYRIALYFADNTTSFGRDISIELASADESVKTLLEYAEELIEKHKRKEVNG